MTGLPQFLSENCLLFSAAYATLGKLYVPQKGDGEFETFLTSNKTKGEIS